MNNEILATEFTRADGMQILHARRQEAGKDLWVVRRTDGICCFYNAEKKDWDVAHAIQDVSKYHMTFDKALNLLSTLPPIR